MKIASVLVSIFLIGCALPPVKFETSEGRVVWHKGSPYEIRSFCAKGDLKANILGCYEMKDNVCHVYSPDNAQSMSTLGHEIKHCFDGYYHERDGRWKEPLEMILK